VSDAIKGLGREPYHNRTRLKSAYRSLDYDELGRKAARETYKRCTGKEVVSIDVELTDDRQAELLTIRFKDGSQLSLEIGSNASVIDGLDVSLLDLGFIPGFKESGR